VIGPLAALRKRPNRRNAPTDHRQVKGGDRQPGDDSPSRLGMTGQRGRHDARPRQGKREVDGHSGKQQHRRAPLARQHHRASGTGAIEHVVAAQQRPRRRGNRRAGCAGQPRADRVPWKSMR